MEYFSDKVKLFILAYPNSKITKIRDINETEIKINIDEPPEKDKANMKLIKYLSKVFKIPKLSITLVSGHTSRRKIIVINYHFESLDDVMRILKEEI